MTQPSPSDRLLQLVEKSGLVDSPRLQGWRQQRGESHLSVIEPQQLAALLVKDNLLTSFQAEQLLGGKWQHFLVKGKYKVLSLLGSGGMGKVYLCEHLRMNRRVALKVLPPQLANEP